jgi:hypothetical protein
VINLHAFAPLWGLSDISPFVTKVDVYLRLTNRPFNLVPFSMESFTSAPKGKFAPPPMSIAFYAARSRAISPCSFR